MKKSITERLLNCSSEELARTAETCRKINNVTAEEYIKERFKGNTDMYAYHVCNRAIEMAREEERRNAVNQLQVVLTAIIARDDNKINFGDIIDQFTKLINQ